jgi:methylglyoxal synthase
MTKRIALIAHDNKKEPLIQWVLQNKSLLQSYELFATGTTGSRVEQASGLKVHKYKSGPLGGDLQIGSMIAEGRLDALVFLWDPLSPHSHDVDVKALLRIAVLYDIPMACNIKTAVALLKIL